MRRGEYVDIRTEVGMPVKTKNPRSGAYRALSEPMTPNTGRWFVYSKMEPIFQAKEKTLTHASTGDDYITRAAKGKGGVSKKNARRRWR
jgi:hypothetical protein